MDSRIIESTFHLDFVSVVFYLECRKMLKSKKKKEMIVDSNNSDEPLGLGRSTKRVKGNSSDSEDEDQNAYGA